MESDFKVVKGTSVAKKNLDDMVSSAFSRSTKWGTVDEDEDSESDEGEVESFRRREVKKMFDMVDRDGSGYIDKAEMSALLRSLNKDYSREEINEGFYHIDKDLSGHVEFLEFYEWYKKGLN